MDPVQQARGHATSEAGALRVSLREGLAPPEGILRRAFAWDDLLEAPAPRSDGPAPYCVSSLELPAGAQRVTGALLVRARPEGGVELEDLVFVAERALGGAIEREREVVGALVEPRRAKAQRLARRRLRRARREKASGGVAHVPHLVGHVAARAWAASLGAVRRLTRAVATMPDALAVRAHRSRRLLATREGRAKFRRGLTDPHGLTAEEKAVTLFVGTAGLLALLVAVHVAVTLSVPELATSWRTVFFLFVYAYGTSLGVPIPLEPVLVGAALLIGKPAALAITLAAKACAAWMVFFVGDAVNHEVKKRAERSPRWARFLAWSEAFARRFGVLALAVFIATPGLPDTVALYLFGSLHMRLWQFILGVALGSLVLNVVVLYGVGALLGF